jgi:hypothetical protein
MLRAAGLITGSGKKPQRCHSERSEESLLVVATMQEGFLAALGMTAPEIAGIF